MCRKRLWGVVAYNVDSDVNPSVDFVGFTVSRLFGIRHDIIFIYSLISFKDKAQYLSFSLW